MSDESYLFDRWMGLLRYKAREYEHAARREGRGVTAPSLDDICNEMNAYRVGRGYGAEDFPEEKA